MCQTCLKEFSRRVGVKGPPKGKELASVRPVVIRKHAYWQFLPDELISLFSLPELPDNLPSVKARQKGPLPCPHLAGLACQPQPQADLQAWHLGQEPHPSAGTQTLPPFPSAWGEVTRRGLPLSGSLKLVTGMRPSIPWEQTTEKRPGILEPEGSLVHVCLTLAEQKGGLSLNHIIESTETGAGEKAQL